MKIWIIVINNMNYYIIVFMSCLLNYNVKIKRYSFLFIFYTGESLDTDDPLNGKYAAGNDTLCVCNSVMFIWTWFYHQGIWMTIRSRSCQFLTPMTKYRPHTSLSYFFSFFFHDQICARNIQLCVYYLFMERNQWLVLQAD